MACKEWIPRWMARMYGEATEVEAAAVDRHLVECVSCREEYEACLATSRVLRAHGPDVPDAPRVVVLTPRARMRAPLAFAAGVVVTSLVALLSFRLGVERAPARVEGPPPASTATVPANVPTERDVTEWANRAVERRLGATGTPLTREELDAALSSLKSRVEEDRRSDLDFVMGRIAASEQRTEGWMDDTQRALQYVAYSANPAISPR